MNTDFRHGLGCFPDKTICVHLRSSVANPLIVIDNAIALHCNSPERDQRCQFRYNAIVTPATAASEPDVLGRLAGEIDEYLTRRLDDLDLPENLAQAVRYAMLGGGKRLRPGLVVLCCEAVG